MPGSINGNMFRSQDARNEEFLRTMQNDGIPATTFRFTNRKKEVKNSLVRFLFWKKIKT